MTPSARCWLLPWLLAGCASSHAPSESPPPVDAGAPPTQAGAFCRPTAAWTPGCEEPPEQLYVAGWFCVDLEGRLQVSGRAPRPVRCEREGDTIRVLPDPCAPSSGEAVDWRADCGPADAVSAIAVDRGRVELTLPPPGTCSSDYEAIDAERLGELLAPIPPTHLCLYSPRSDCGAAVYFRVVLEGMDSALGLNFHQCVARFDGDAIRVALASRRIVEPELAFLPVGRIAECAVMVDTPGTYPVRTEAGDLLGELVVRDAEVRSLNDPRRRCAEVPSP